MSSPSGPEESERRDDAERADPADRLEDVDPSDMPAGAGETEPGDDTADEQWRYGVDEVGEGAPTRDPLEPESISLENALFVAVGVLLTVGILLVGVL